MANNTIANTMNNTASLTEAHRFTNAQRAAARVRIAIRARLPLRARTVDLTSFYRGLLVLQGFAKVAK